MSSFFFLFFFFFINSLTEHLYSQTTQGKGKKGDVFAGKKITHAEIYILSHLELELHGFFFF